MFSRGQLCVVRRGLAKVYILALAAWVQGTFAALRAAWWVPPSEIGVTWRKKWPYTRQSEGALNVSELIGKKKHFLYFFVQYGSTSALNECFGHRQVSDCYTQSRDFDPYVAQALFFPRRNRDSKSTPFETIKKFPWIFSAEDQGSRVLPVKACAVAMAKSLIQSSHPTWFFTATQGGSFDYGTLGQGAEFYSIHQSEN